MVAQHHPRGGGRRAGPGEDQGAPTESRLRRLRGAPSLIDRMLSVRVGGRTRGSVYGPLGRRGREGHFSQPLHQTVRTQGVDARR